MTSIDSNSAVVQRQHQSCDRKAHDGNWREVAFWLGIVSALTVGGIVIGRTLPARPDPTNATEFLKVPGPRAPM